MGGGVLPVLLVILLRTQMPQILVDSLVARLFLRPEVCDVRGYLAQVTAASLNSATDSRKAVTDELLIAGDWRGTFGSLTQIYTVAVCVCGSCCAVCCQQHFAT